MLRGILSAMVSPMNADETLDLPTLRVLVDRTVAAGAHGVVVCGSAGEFAQLTTSERKTVVETVVDQVSGKIPIVAHVGALRTGDAVQLARHAESNGATAVMVLAPFYEPLSLDELKTYYRTIADATALPVMIYNLPDATGVNLAPSDVAAIAEASPNIQYVKDSSGDFRQAATLIRDYSDVITTLVGWDSMLFGALVEGAVGAVMGSGNLIAPQLVSMYDLVQQGKFDEGREEWKRIFPLMNFLVSGAYTPATKAALEIMGMPVGPVRSPVAETSGPRRKELASILTKLELI